MNRTKLISIGIIIILFIVGAWIYLMLFGTPKNADEVYTNLGFSSVSQPVTVTPTESTGTSTDTTQIDTTSQALNQLTTRPVAGFMPITSTSSNLVRYMERGTGHIFDIDLQTGEETRISPNTIPQVSEAVFSKDGNTVAIIINQDYTSNLALGNITSTGLQTTQVSSDAENVSFLDNTTLAYTESVSGITVGYQYDTITDTKEVVFQFAFAELDVWWGSDTQNTFILSKPAANLPTYSYKITNKELTPTLPAHNGLSGFSDHTKHILTYNTTRGYFSFLSNEDSDTLLPLPILLLSDKCDFDAINHDFIWCGSPKTLDDDNYVENWYKGTLVSSDYIWLVNLNTQAAELVVDPEDVSGRSVDVTHMTSNQEGSDLFFLNRTDRTLWRYNLLAE